MAKLHQQDQQNLTFDEMMRFLDSEFQRFPEHRAGNAVRYELADVLKSAFAMFALKSPSLLDFKKQTIAEESNLRSIFRIEGAIVHSKKSILRMKTAFIDCAEANFLFVVAICIVLS